MIKMKNYTSTVPISRTISRIEEILVRSGAVNIIKDYRGPGTLDALCFTYIVGEKKIAIRLPANVKAVESVLRGSMKRPRAGTMDRIADQAERTAWKIIQDWIEIQISLIEMKQAEFLQVFMPYIWNGKTTLFQSFKESGFRGYLPEHKS
jgi:hypothetical protein